MDKQTAAHQWQQQQEPTGSANAELIRNYYLKINMMSLYRAGNQFVFLLWSVVNTTLAKHFSCPCLQPNMYGSRKGAEISIWGQLHRDPWTMCSLCTPVNIFHNWFDNSPSLGHSPSLQSIRHRRHKSVYVLRKCCDSSRLCNTVSQRGRQGNSECYLCEWRQFVKGDFSNRLFGFFRN